MKYLCLAYYEEAKFDTLTKADMEAMVTECRPHDEAFRGSGKVRLTTSLEHRKAVVVRPRGGKVSVTDGPFVETKEQVGSAFIIEAENLEEAVRIASLHPAARLNEHLGWGIEVRPIEMYLES